MHQDLKILALIPARAGSKGIPDKNKKVLNGKPLIQYTLEHAQQSKQVTTIAVSSDDPGILEVAAKWTGLSSAILRPQRLATDQAKMIDVIVHALDYYQSIQRDFDYVCLLQPTCPFRKKGLIDTCIEKIRRMNGDSLTTIRRTPEKYHPNWAFKMDAKQKLSQYLDSQLIARRQDLPILFHRDGQIYITKTNMIRQGKILGGTVIGYVNEYEPDINLDSMADWNEAEKWIENGY